MSVVFYRKGDTVYAVGYSGIENSLDRSKLEWLFGNARVVNEKFLDGIFIGPRKEMITPWSTNAVEITQNMGINGIFRIEEFIRTEEKDAVYDPMLKALYRGLDARCFEIERQPEPIVYIDNIEDYNKEAGLALNGEEIDYLISLEAKLGRKLTDSEVFGFSQVNSEHCRHKIFNGDFVIDGVKQPISLFGMIKLTSKLNPNRIVSAYKDNCAFIQGPAIGEFAPERQDMPAFFRVRKVDTVISLKAETHNFPTTVEPFNGAATGTGGEIRDRIAGGQAAMPLAGTAVYMTSYPRLESGRFWESKVEPRQWLYQSPRDILIKASNGASDFGNKFGQPLICGSLLTFEHEEKGRVTGFDKVVMLAGGVGYANAEQALKHKPEPGDKVVLLGGDNYRIGMGGGAVSSVDTGVYENAIELNAVQRSNPEMQKRVCNVIRAMAESDVNPIVSIHDHGAGGHLNCLSELVEETGGKIYLDRLPVGDPTLSYKEIVGNESQERMGLVLKEKDLDFMKRVAERERAPFYVIGETTGDDRFVFESEKTGLRPIELELKDMFGSSPKTVMEDCRTEETYAGLAYTEDKLEDYVKAVLSLESVASKDWLTNKADRSVTGRIAVQQCQGPLQLPLSNLGAVALDFTSGRGIATSLGHAPAAALRDSAKGSRLAIAEALTNIVWAELEGGLQGVSLSANWMWPCRNKGEDARLYDAVRAASDFASALEINIPTGKDSLSMTQKYKDMKVNAPGTVIISAVAEAKDVRRIVSPVLSPDENTLIVYIDFSKDAFKLGGSAFAQTRGRIGDEVPDVAEPSYFYAAFVALQQLIGRGLVLAGHDISSGGMITALMEMCFADNRLGMEIDLSHMSEKDTVKILFAENPGVLIQIAGDNCRIVGEILENFGLNYSFMGKSVLNGKLSLKSTDKHWNFDLNVYRDIWMKTSYLLDSCQTAENMASERYNNYKHNVLDYKFPEYFKGNLSLYASENSLPKAKAAVIREKGVNGDREMAWALYLAGFEVKDVHMTDLMSGRETLEDTGMIVFVGGFSNSDVLGSAKGWAGAFRYNDKARTVLENFYRRENTLSLGVCNGCQLMTELGLIYPDREKHPKLTHNRSGKFESGFVSVDILPNNSVMLSDLAGSRLGVWIAHGEGRFVLEEEEKAYGIPMKYSYDNYPANPNGSPYAVAALCSEDGRHLAMMPHIERSLYPWNWGWYDPKRKTDEITPWITAFVNARKWLENR